MTNPAFQLRTEQDRQRAFNPRPFAFRPCPACRGYELERRWCGLCDGRGVVEVRRG